MCIRDSFCADISGNFQTMTREREYVLKVVRRMFQTKEYIQQKSVMPFLCQSPAYSRGGYAVSYTHLVPG